MLVIRDIISIGDIETHPILLRTAIESCSCRTVELRAISETRSECEMEVRGVRILVRDWSAPDFERCQSPQLLDCSQTWEEDVVFHADLCNACVPTRMNVPDTMSFHIIDALYLACLHTSLPEACCTGTVSIVRSSMQN